MGSVYRARDPRLGRFVAVKVIVRVGSAGGEKPHLLLGGHSGGVTRVAVSPDGRWVASVSDGGSFHLWPMPDVTKPPLHTLPHAELMAKLEALTNLRVVRDSASSTGSQHQDPRVGAGGVGSDVPEPLVAGDEEASFPLDGLPEARILPARHPLLHDAGGVVARLPQPLGHRGREVLDIRLPGPAGSAWVVDPSSHGRTRLLGMTDRRYGR